MITTLGGTVTDRNDLRLGYLPRFMNLMHVYVHENETQQFPAWVTRNAFTSVLILIHLV